MTRRRLRAAFIGAAATWPLLIVAATFAAGRPHASPLGSALIVGVYAIGSAICHQLPERSFHLWGAQMPVCARCAGIYVGAAVAALAAPLRAPGTAEAGRHTSASLVQGVPTALPGFIPATTARRLLALAVLPSLITLVYEWSTGIAPAHMIRAAAGIPIGVVVAWLVVAATHNQVN
jgi:uncharacterized membrane protein